MTLVDNAGLFTDVEDADFLFWTGQAWMSRVNVDKGDIGAIGQVFIGRRKFGEDPEKWGLIGLLHDFDWEIHPTLEQHPQHVEQVVGAVEDGHHGEAR